MNSVRVFALMALAPLAVAAKSDSGRLVLRVIDGAQVPAVTLQKAMHRVESASRAAGIEMQWLSTCLVDSTAPEPKRTACEQTAPGVSHVLEICILGTFGVASTVRSDVLGIANVASGRAYILWNRIRGSELAKAASEDKALAMVMLHEAGHVAGLPHSPTGIMRPEMCTASAAAASAASGLDHRSLNINTFDPIYVLMGYALPKEAQSPPIQRAGSFQTGVYPQIAH